VPVICPIDLRVASSAKGLFAHQPLDVLDDDDRIVDQQPDGQHDPDSA
jgi:hypothetical protein